MLALAQEYTQMIRRGDRWWGLSPFKQERTPSFCVSPEKNIYYCFSTQKGGGVFNFIMEIEKMNFPEAVEYLAKRLGIALMYTSPSQNNSSGYRDELRTLYRRVTKSLVYLLNNTPQGRGAQQYFMERGIHLQSIKTRLIGYAPADPQWLYSFLASKGYSESFMSRCGLFTNRKKSRALFVDRIIFPICDKWGQPVAFGGRTMRAGAPKYINSPTTQLFHKGSLLYGIESAITEARRRNTIYLVEGYIDQLALWQSGAVNCVAPLGTALTTEQALLLKQICDNVVIVFDSDEAGIQAMLRASKVLLQNHIEAQLCLFPSPYDPADILQQKGAETLLKMLDTHSKHLIEFLPEYFLGTVTDIHDHTSHLAFQRIFEYISLVGSNIRREQYLYWLADYSGISRDSIIKDYAQHVEKRVRNIQRADRNTPQLMDGKNITRAHVQKNVQQTGSNRELFLMLASYAHPDEFGYVRSQLDEGYFYDSRARTLFRALDQAFRNNELAIDSMLQYIENTSLRQHVSRSLASNEFSESGRELIHDGVRSLQKRHFQHKRTRLIRELENHNHHDSDSDKPEQSTEITRLQYEIIYLNEEIQKRQADWHHISSKPRELES